MILAWFYVQRNKQPEAKPVAAYMIFMVVLSTAAVLLFVVFSYLLALIGLMPLIDQALGAVLFLAVIFGAALRIAKSVLAMGPMRGPDVE